MKNSSPTLTLVLALAGLMLLPACDEQFTNDFPEPEPEQADTGKFSGVGYGLTCEETEECRDGLKCNVDGIPKCLPAGDKKMNEKCLLTDECSTEAAEAHPHGLHCGWAGFCVPACVGCLAPGETAADCSEDATGQDTMIAALGCSAGTGEVGSDCATSSECQRGLYCQMQGLSGYCANAGTKDLGDNCGDTGECLAALRCSTATGKCEAGSLLLYPDLFGGVPCSTEGLSFGARMAIPGTEGHSQFFAFPYPSDVHLNDDGTVNLLQGAGSPELDFPVPGDGLIGFDPIGKTIEALDDEIVGWSLLSGIWFQFTGEVDTDSLVANESVRLVRLPDGEMQNINVEFDLIRNKFACGNRVFLQPILARPLEKNTTYAAIVTTQVTSKETGESAQQLDDLKMLLDANALSSMDPPAGEAEMKAYQSFAPLREWLASGTTPLNSNLIAGATVFTTGDPTAVVGDIRALVHTKGVPEMTWKIACEPNQDGEVPASRCGTPLSPNDPSEAEDKRGCPATPSGSYAEFHTTVKIPIIQRGTRPYLDDEGTGSGDLNIVGGDLVAKGFEEICVAISVPTGQEPNNGWPVLLYGHGTGGTHRQGIALLGEELGREGSTDGPKDRFVVVAWDQPMHHLRRFPLDDDGRSLAVKDADPGDDTYVLKPEYEEEYAKEPGPLFYNFQNPRAARANYLQATADTFALVKLLKDGSLNMPGLGPVNIRDDRIAYHGHSQGGGNGPMVAPFEEDIGLMILSGTGGSTVDGILGKKQPYDSSVGCRIMLQEIDVTRTHPGMHILQHYFDAIDPGIYGPLMVDPPSGADMNFMQVVGVGDSFTPPVSMAAYAGSADTDLLIPPSGPLPVWADDMEDDLITHADYTSSDCPGGLPVCVLPNRPEANPTHTRVSIQHPPCAEDDGTQITTDELTQAVTVSQCAGGVAPDFDGHFVVYRNLDALAEMLSFINSWSLTGTAVVSPAGSNAN